MSSISLPVYCDGVLFGRVSIDNESGNEVASFTPYKMKMSGLDLEIAEDENGWVEMLDDKKITLAVEE